MGAISRRQLLTTVAATAAVAALPLISAVADAPLAAPAEVIPSWVVGSSGEFNWRHIVARTQREALRFFAEDLGDYDGEECGHEDYQEGCECCEAVCCYEVDRVPRFDGKATITAADWLRANLGHICSRCSYETFREEGGHPVGDEAVCSDCMTLADWDVVDPERAAELRAELADEGVSA